ncbi:hypothetical protein LY90DRAFT_665063 [Neocallimastix californiae]|jgi:hypothetical protein|uniref:PH domain-containing protein n=1 Tax=Neocallimastix californiae TaxID=1754190 RepID=A0A1Y2F4S3_9FUNG|nr:hypothetical protein LY90DRAFT_665063 [Neocallimastix californiae]|eukprot:ORY78336.1 hypothetical protein LY90DRAFT_665063 [Neocallimastix californiae]
MNTYGNQLDIIKKGYLIHKRHTKIYVILCSPISIADVSTVFYSIFGRNGGLENRAAILGNIAFAAMEETPLLILLASEKETSRPIFIHFMNINSIDDEVKLGQACCMRLHTNKADFTLSASTSTDYQDWISAFREAYTKSHQPSKRKTINTNVDDVDDIEENHTVNNVDPNIFIPYSPTATLNHNRSSPKQEKPLFGRLFSQCIPETSNNNNGNNNYNNSAVRSLNLNKGHHHYSAAAPRNIPSMAAQNPRHRISYQRTSSPSNISPPSTSAVTPTIIQKKPIDNTTKLSRAKIPTSIPVPMNITTTITTVNPPTPSIPASVQAVSDCSNMPPLTPSSPVNDDNPATPVSLSLQRKQEIPNTESAIPIKTN